MSGNGRGVISLCVKLWIGCYSSEVVVGVSRYLVLEYYIITIISNSNSLLFMIFLLRWYDNIKQNDGTNFLYVNLVTHIVIVKRV